MMLSVRRVIVLCFCRVSVNPVNEAGMVEPPVGRTLTAAGRTVNVVQTDDSSAVAADSASVQQELMVVDSYYSDRKPVQDDVISSSEAMQTGWLKC